MRKYHVRFGGGMMEKEHKSHLASFPPYFLSLGAKFHERELENALVEQIQKTLIEFGHGFAFVGRQYPLEVDGQTFYIDLLFYHIPSHRFVVVELKAEDFKPEHTGKMNFYLAVLDDKVKTELDFPSIGLILCKRKSKFVAEYALRHINNLMAVSGYGSDAVEELLLGLPSVEEIEAELDKDMIELTVE